VQANRSKSFTPTSHQLDYKEITRLATSTNVNEKM